MNCDAAMRLFRPGNDTEVRCGMKADHPAEHVGSLHDYAYPGSRTEIHWSDDDRRSFRGDWPGSCSAWPACILPSGHHGNHAA